MCEDYVAGPIAGKKMAVCRHYVLEPAESKGGCRHPAHFMCVFWLEALGKKVIQRAQAPLERMTEAVLSKFPGSRVIENRRAG